MSTDKILVAICVLAAPCLALAWRYGSEQRARPCAAFADDRREDVPARCFRDFDPAR